MASATNSPTVTSAALSITGVFDRLIELHDAAVQRITGKPVLQIDEAANDSDTA